MPLFLVLMSLSSKNLWAGTTYQCSEGRGSLLLELERLKDGPLSVSAKFNNRKSYKGKFIGTFYKNDIQATGAFVDQKGDIIPTGLDIRYENETHLFVSLYSLQKDIDLGYGNHFSCQEVKGI